MAIKRMLIGILLLWFFYTPPSAMPANDLPPLLFEPGPAMIDPTYVPPSFEPGPPVYGVRRA